MCVSRSSRADDNSKRNHRLGGEMLEEISFRSTVLWERRSRVVLEEGRESRKSRSVIYSTQEEAVSSDNFLDNKGFSHIEGDVLMYLITDSPTTI